MARSTINLKFPRRAEFTILDVINQNASLSSPTVRKHVKVAVSNGVLINTGRSRKGIGRGRPAFLFTRAN